MKKQIVLLTAIFFAVTMVMVGCKAEVEHQHKFSEKWEIDEYYHWKECSCGEIDFEAEHTYGE